jgi:hypothetical protein
MVQLLQQSRERQLRLPTKTYNVSAVRDRGYTHSGSPSISLRTWRNCRFFGLPAPDSRSGAGISFVLMLFSFIALEALPVDADAIDRCYKDTGMKIATDSGLNDPHVNDGAGDVETSVRSYKWAKPSRSLGEAWLSDERQSRRYR